MTPLRRPGVSRAGDGREGRPAQRLRTWKGTAVQTAGGETHWVLQRIPPSKRDALEGLARWVGQVTGAPVEVGNAADVLGLGIHSLAALCYFPVQGIWLMASVAVLIFSKNAEARFAAKMSLAYHGLSGGAWRCGCWPPSSRLYW